MSVLSVTHTTEISENGNEIVKGTLHTPIKRCEECDSTNVKLDETHGETVCMSCGLVQSDKLLMFSYYKPTINFRTPHWRQPKYYDTKFFKLMNKLDNNNTIHFNYTSKNSKNYEKDGKYTKYITPTINKAFKLFLSYINDVPNLNSKLNPTYSKGHHEQSYHICKGEPINTPTRVTTMTDYDMEYHERQKYRNRALKHLGTQHEDSVPYPHNEEDIRDINRRACLHRQRLMNRGLTI